MSIYDKIYSSICLNLHLQGFIIYTYKRAVCVCLSVCLLFIGHTTFVHFAALPPSPRAGAERPRASGQACTATARARMPYNFSTKKSYADAFQKQNCTRVHAVVYVTAEIFKKGNKKTNMPLPKFSLQFAFSWSVYFSNRTESYSSQIEFAGPHGITENQATYLHCGGEARAEERLERRREQDRRRHAARSTKTTIMTVHVNPIMQAAPSQRRIVSIGEASNQLLFHSQKLLFVE